MARVLLDTLLDATPAADAGGVDEHHPARGLAEFDDRVDAVARRPRDLAHDRALGADERVEEARLSDVGAADDGHARVGRLGFLHRRGQLLGDRVEEIAGADPLDRRDRERRAQAELVELRGLRLAAPGVGLVRDEEHGLSATAEQVGDVVLDRKDAALRVDDEQDHVGLPDRGLRLAAYGRLHLAGLRVVESPGVDERELAAAPLGGRVDAVARRAGKVLDDRDAFTDEAIEQRRFADVGPPNDRDDGPAHRG